MSYVLEIQVINKDLLPFYRNSVKKLNENLHKKHKDSGFDLFIPAREVQCEKCNDDPWRREDPTCSLSCGCGELFWTFSPGETRLINLGIRCAAYEMQTRKDYNETTYLAPQAFYIYPRSSIYKTPLRLANGTGIIDNGYRGNLKAAFDNIKPQTYVLKKHVRLLQICMPNLSPFKVKLVNKLETTERGANGFGSSGV